MFSRTRPGRGIRSYHPWSNRGSLVVQTSMCVEAHLSRRLVCQVLRPSRARFAATKTFKAALSSYECLGRDRQRNRGFFSGMLRGVSNAREGLKILTFLFGPRLVCSSLLPLRCSWKVNPANYFALMVSEVIRCCLAVCSLWSLEMSASASAACRMTGAALWCGKAPLLSSSSLWTGSSPANYRLLANAATAGGEEISSRSSGHNSQRRPSEKSTSTTMYPSAP